MDQSINELNKIVHRCQSGDQTAYNQLFRLIKTDVHRVLISTIGPDSELEDIMQIAFMEIFRSLPRFRGDSKFSTWMYRLVVNVALQHLRKRKGTPEPVDISERANQLINPEDPPEKQVNHREQLRIVNEILQDIAPKKRIVFVLHEIEGHSPEEIAKIVNASKLTVKSRLFYAKKDFYKKLRQKALLESSRVDSGPEETVE